MFKIKSSQDFIYDIRNLDKCLERTIIKSIEIKKENEEIFFNFICDKTVDKEVQQRIREYIKNSIDCPFAKINVNIIKIVSNSELIINSIFKYLNSNYPSVSIFLKITDIICVVLGEVVKYTIKLNKSCAEYFEKSGVIKKLNTYLSNNFCSSFAGFIEEKSIEESICLEDEEVYENELQRIEYRSIKVDDVIVIDDATIGDVAYYIEDLKKGNAIVCGTITEIAERTAKTGKPYYIIHIDDTTGKINGVYFTRKNTVDKIKYLAIGDCIIARGNLGEYNGKKSFTFEKINRCTFPKNFVKKEKYKKSAPLEYSLVFPDKANNIKINSVFDYNQILPEELCKNTYVVLDIETTGLDLMNNGITEIGAVKLVNGIICEQFTTLIKPDYHISEEIVSLTGISDDMVKDSPKINLVIPDFMKFIDGAILVAQNAEFDIKFLKKFASAIDYEIKNKVLDTMEMSRTLIPNLKRNNLKTLAEYFNITFHHHRALSDAYATAEIFIELMKIKNKNA